MSGFIANRVYSSAGIGEVPATLSGENIRDRGFQGQGFSESIFPLLTMPEQELLTIVFVFEKFWSYLLLSLINFEIIIDICTVFL